MAYSSQVETVCYTAIDNLSCPVRALWEESECYESAVPLLLLPASLPHLGPRILLRVPSTVLDNEHFVKKGRATTSLFFAGTGKRCLHLAGDAALPHSTRPGRPGAVLDPSPFSPLPIPPPPQLRYLLQCPNCTAVRSGPGKV